MCSFSIHFSVKVSPQSWQREDASMAKVQRQLISSPPIITFISTCRTEVKCLKQVLLRRVILFVLNFWQKAGQPAKIGSVCPPPRPGSREKRSKTQSVGAEGAAEAATKAERRGEHELWQLDPHAEALAKGRSMGSGSTSWNGLTPRPLASPGGRRETSWSCSPQLVPERT